MTLVTIPTSFARQTVSVISHGTWMLVKRSTANGKLDKREVQRFKRENFWQLFIQYENAVANANLLKIPIWKRNQFHCDAFNNSWWELIFLSSSFPNETLLLNFQSVAFALTITFRRERRRYGVAMIMWNVVTKIVAMILINRVSLLWQVMTMMSIWMVRV